MTPMASQDQPDESDGSGVVIVGGGMAGAQAAIALRLKGFAEPVTLLESEDAIPYQRPPLSKEFLKGEMEEDELALRPAQFWEDREVKLLTGAGVDSIHRRARRVQLTDGRVLRYDHLILATGAGNRQIPGLSGSAHVMSLRTLDDARALRPRLRAGERIAIIGGGFIGMEVAAAARGHGAEVTVIEAVDRIMARALSVEMSQFFRRRHEEHGVQVITGNSVSGLRDDDGRLTVELGDGTHVDADLLLVGVGVAPNTMLASDAGLAVDDGVIVDERLLTSDKRIFAIGDCARFPTDPEGGHQRLESIQNATDQAQHVAGVLTGIADAYTAVPWFWSHQYGDRLQIAGVAPEGASSVLRGAPDATGFSVCRFADGTLVAVESVNKPADHLAARKLLASPAASQVTPAQAADTSVALKTFVLAAI